MRTITAALLLAALAGPARAERAAKLDVGDPAPALKDAPGVKGKPVEGFAKGKIYVVEFWATWCGPCVKSIPHLTELAKKHADKVTVIGVSIGEAEDEKDDAEALDRVKKFVADMGAKMGYLVA